MKKHTEILLTIQSRQEMLDNFNQSVQTVVDIEGAKFDDNTKNNVMAEVMEAINNLRIIEEALLANTAGYWVAVNGPSRMIYNPSVDGYISTVPTPQFTTISAYQMYYTEKLAALKAEIEAEQLETAFIFDNETTINTRVNKAAGGSNPWAQAETDIIAAITVMQASLIGDNPDSAVS